MCVTLLFQFSACKAASYYGRLYIPSVGIDVGLYQSADRQGAVDREDSACIFRLSYGRRTRLIADHNTQSFAPLFEVIEGTTGYIVPRDGETIHIICVEVLDGHNTGRGITDKNRQNVVGAYDYLMYTCNGYHRNVRICQWNIQELQDQEEEEHD
jgi:hypothetical protein